MAAGPSAAIADDNGDDMANTQLGVGMVGHAFMGAAHSQAWRTAPHFFDLPLHPFMRIVAGRDGARAATAAERLGWSGSTGRWQDLLERDDIDLIDVCSPGDTHAEVAIAALEAGKHVLCEKPLANTVDEAVAMAEAAARAEDRGVRAMVAFNYRRVPAVALARQFVAEGRLGDIRHVRGVYLQDWIVDPEFPLVWRLQAERSGSGALGDLGAHIVDLAQHVTGDALRGVSALTETFIRERPLPEASAGLSASGGGGATGAVTVDDAALFLGRFAGGAVATFEATRFATGRKNALRLEVNGSRGSLAFDFEAMNELWFHDHALDAREAGFRRILATEPSHPYIEAWWPPGHGLGYEHTFTHEVADLVTAIAEDEQPTPTFADGLQVQRVLQAVLDSATADSAWTEVAS
jgi:predicted dehydrogenase